MISIKYVLLVLIIPFILSCSSALDDYDNTTPEFDLATYFDGEVTAWGIVQDYSNKLTRRFCVDIVGTWQGNKGQLHETFYYNNDEQQIRIWDLIIAGDGSVTGGAADVIGQASGGSQGTAFNWQYTLRIPVDDTEYDLFVDDWMFMLDTDRVMNRSYMKKLGVTVAEISIFFDKTKPVRKCQ
ncbi:DUF3833 domain-containing protein [uncultured Paraglaciecola sp.]|uniref:DUF3833 domain-containing protein n=1 Tax=uncultured Paraglaciecola sp. TaxID=1765024 RepID=UPI0025EEA871|nr:DUF3833 domain-containing protein [uncultured Paraglaciecola sp.]